MIWTLGSAFKHLFLPPVALGWLLLLAWLIMRRHPRTGRWLVGLTFILAYVVSTPWFSGWLMLSFVADSTPPAATAPQAIVVLGGGRGLAFDADGHSIAGFPAGYTLERLITGAQLQKRTGLPLLVTGGKVDGYDPSEGQAMRDSLVGDFGVPVRWVEGASRNTVENAAFSAPLLRAAGVTTIYLVTSDFHMHRARALFEAQGFATVPVAALAVLGPDGRPLPRYASPFNWRELVPTANAAEQTYFACNELAGMIYARLNMR